ncbi:MAG TPA: hypothetical protein VF660_08210 [Actinomycetota bacterium]|jgi:anti-sigma factor RsiW
MKCEEVRPLIPELAEGLPREAGEVELHLETCVACSAELERYRSVVLALGALQDVVMEPPAGFLDRTLAQVREGPRRSVMSRVATDGRLQYAALSLGGALVGAAAIGLLWRRSARRSVAATTVAAGAAS